MRFKGTLKSWNDDRGFGFIEPIQGGEDIFVHIKAFNPRSGRPQINEVFWFEVEPGPQGKKRAKNVELVRRATRSEVRPEQSTQAGSLKLVAIPGFVFLFVVVGILWQPPLIIGTLYLAGSVITFVAYAIDKSAAQRGAWRTSENTLHLLSFAGGWPGALLAQHYLRHKSAKYEFRVFFWSTVILNVAGFVLFCSPQGQQLWAPLQ